MLQLPVELRLLRRAEAGEARVGLEQPRLALQRGRLRRAHHLQVLGPIEHGELARRESDYLLVAAAGRGVVGGEGGGDGASEGRRRRTRGEMLAAAADTSAVRSALCEEIMQMDAYPPKPPPRKPWGFEVFAP